MTNISELLKRIVNRCRENLSSNERAKAYLCENTIENEATWAAFRAGVGDDALLSTLTKDERLSLESIGLRCIHGRFALHAAGIVLPTFDPREPETPIGFVKQNYAQNKHAFITSPRGLACGGDILSQQRVVICDAPFLALRMAQAGVSGVVLAEVPEVLAPHTEWLTSREVLLASHKRTGLESLKAGLGSDKAASVVIPTDLQRLTKDGWAALGISIEKLAEVLPLPSAALLADLVKFAQARIANGEGVELLREYGADDRAFIEAYGVGFLPINFQSALSTEARKAFSNRIEGNSLIVPAFDTAGNIVDVMALRPKSQNRSLHCLHAQPVGLVAPKVASAFEDVVVTDSFKLAAKLFREGKQNTLLLRGIADAQNNAERLALSGIQSATVIARRDGVAIVSVLEKSGITSACEVCTRENTKPVKQEAGAVTASQLRPETPSTVLPTSVDPIQRVSIDRKTEQAVFKTGDCLYIVDATLDNGTKLLVRMDYGGKVALDKFDVAVEAQRKRFATSAALKLKLESDAIDGHLVCILDSLKQWREEQTQSATLLKPVVEISDAEKAEGLAFLRRADLLDCIAKDLESLGWVGEEKSKRLLYLASISRKLPAPLSAALLASSGAGKSKSIETIAELAPPEDLVHVSRLTDSALYYQNKDALRHKLLVVDEADALTPEVLVSLRILQSRGALTQSHVLRDTISGAASTQFVETRGPVAVLTSTAGKLEEQMLSRCFEVSIDETPEQTARILDIQRKLRADRGNLGQNGKHATTVRRHHTLQRLLENLPVVVPFADRIQFPATSIKHRREQERFLNLIEASALLHQHQRLKEKTDAGETFIIADVRDYDIAMKLASDHIGRASDQLSGHAREVLGVIQSAKLESFDINDLHGLRPQWTRHKFRSGLDELQKLDVITTGKRSRPRKYELCVSAASLMAASAVRLLPFGELAGFGETAFANSIPARAIG